MGPQPTFGMLNIQSQARGMDVRQVFTLSRAPSPDCSRGVNTFQIIKMVGYVGIKIRLTNLM